MLKEQPLNSIVPKTKPADPCGLTIGQFPEEPVVETPVEEPTNES